MYKLGLEKVGETDIKLPMFAGSQRKQGKSGKNIYSASLTTLKSATVQITINCNIFKETGILTTTLSVSWETCIWLKKQQLEMNLEQLTGSKLGKEYVKAVCCHPADLTYMQSTSCEMPSWMNHKQESTLSGETSTTSDMQMIPL